MGLGTKITLIAVCREPGLIVAMVGRECDIPGSALMPFVFEGALARKVISSRYPYHGGRQDDVILLPRA